MRKCALTNHGTEKLLGYFIGSQFMKEYQKQNKEKKGRGYNLNSYK